MRKLIISAALAAVAAVSFAAPSQAGGYGHHRHGGFSVTFYNAGYYGGGYYGGGYYEPSCYIKKVKRWDQWGNVYFRRIKICD